MLKLGALITLLPKHERQMILQKFGADYLAFMADHRSLIGYRIKW